MVPEPPLPPPESSPHGSEPVKPLPPASPPEPPPEVVARFAEFFQAQASIEPLHSPMERAMAAALRQEHIKILLAQAEKREDNRHREQLTRQNARWKLTVWVLALVLAAVCILAAVAYTTNHPEHVVPVISIVVGLVGTAFGAYTLGRGSRRRTPRRDAEPTTLPPTV